MAGLISLINRLLPFATPGTPLVQDLLHLAALCTALYYAPQLQAYYQRTLQGSTGDDGQALNDSDASNDNAQNDTLPPQQDGPVDQHNPVQAEAHELHHEGNAIPQPNEDDSDNDNDLENDPQFNAAVNLDNAPGQAGPAGPAHTPANRAIGAKKARSLARRDQRRAYHEFVRSQADAARAADAADATDREKAASLERERRARVEEEVRERERVVREERRERERAAREEEWGRREGVVRRVRGEVGQRGMVDLGALAVEFAEREEWIERLVKASGLLGRSEGGEVTMLTGEGWIVRVGKDEINEMASLALGESTTEGGDGKVSYQRLGGVLESVLRKRAAAA